MKWKDFITPIQKSGITSDAAYKIVLDLFKQAGSINDISEAAAKSWLSGNRNCKASTHFPSGEVNTVCLFHYFRNRPDGKLQQLQQTFQAGKELDADSPIDRETDNMDVFCWSLVNQFLDLIGFQRIGIPHTDTPLETSYSSHSISSTDISAKRKLSIRSTILPHADKFCCYYCKFWSGDRETIGAHLTSTYGPCLKYGGERKLSSDIACKDFKERTKLPMEW